MKKRCLALFVILSIIICFMVIYIIQQNINCRNTRKSLVENYEATKYDIPFNEYLDNHFKNKTEFEFSVPVGKQAIEVRKEECFEQALNKRLIVGSWPKDNPPFCSISFGYKCIGSGGISIEGIVDEVKNNCKNNAVISCTCWF